jgi:hypothetical protein
MENIFNTIGKQLYTSSKHSGYLLRWGLVAPLCQKWSRNREPDPKRVAEMLEYHKNGGYILRMIHMAYIQGEGLVCYDGNHRREVFNQFLSDDSLMCVVDVMFDATQQQVYEAFMNINKSVEVPELYLEPTDSLNTQVQSEIFELAKEYANTYKPFVSSSARCHPPNFNRDILIDNLHHIYKSFKCLLSVKQIAKMLEVLNEKYANEELGRPHCLYRPIVIEKCKKYNMWLFLEKTIPFEHVEKVANMV